MATPSQCLNMRKFINEKHHFYFHFLDVEKNVPEGIHQKEVSSRVRQDEVIERNPLPKPGEVETNLIGTPLTAVKFHILSQILAKHQPRSRSYLNLTLLEVMWSSQASQKALTAIRAAAFWMGTLMCSTDVNTGANTRSATRWQSDLSICIRGCVITDLRGFPMA